MADEVSDTASTASPLSESVQVGPRRSARRLARTATQKLDEQSSDGLRRSSAASLEAYEQDELAFDPVSGSTKRKAMPEITKPRRFSARELEDYLIGNPLTQKERDNWTGWAELESDPAYFNVILRDWGVQGVKVQEVLSLEDNMVASLPKPMYGLILLFEYVEDGEEEQCEKCPEHIWFAKQTISNACATMALLNIVTNVPSVELGSTIQSLKETTKAMTPDLRGQAVSTDSFIRKVHNSFATRMDILDAELCSRKAEEEKRKEAHRKQRKSTRKRTATKSSLLSDEPAFHFIAFIPIKGCVWRLDGLDQGPRNLGEFEGDWMSAVRPHIQAMMASQQGKDSALKFTLLSLCRSPLLSIPVELAANIRALVAVETRLSEVKSDWRMFIEPNNDNTLRSAEATFGVTSEMIESAADSPMIVNNIEDNTIGVGVLIDMRNHIIDGQNTLRRLFLEEAAAVEDNNQHARAQRQDDRPAIQNWLKALDRPALLKLIREDMAEQEEQMTI